MQTLIPESFNEFLELLSRIDLAHLPGDQARLSMAPRLRLKEILEKGQGKDPVKSSVLFLLYPGKDHTPHTVFIQRPMYNGAHSGQISFPGGRAEPEDASVEETALREAWEETGIDASMVKVMGRLSDLYIPPSNFLVAPVIGISGKRPQFVADPSEVESIIEVPLADLFNPDNCRITQIKLKDGLTFDTPCFQIQQHTIWGATVIIIAELLALFNHHPRPK